MDILNKSTVKKWFKEEMLPVVKPFGYKIGILDHNFTIFKKSPEMCVDMPLDTKSWYADIDLMLLRLLRPEQILQDLGASDRSLGQETLYAYRLEPALKLVYDSCPTREAFSSWLSPLKEAFPELAARAEYFSDMRNILDHWDSLPSSEERSRFMAHPYNDILIAIMAGELGDPRFARYAQEAVDEMEKWSRIAVSESYPPHLIDSSTRRLSIARGLSERYGAGK